MKRQFEIGIAGWLIGGLGVLLALGVSCSSDETDAASGMAGVCASTTSCATDEDCPDGSRCNTALSTPRCAAVDCAALGAECSDDALCANDLACRGDRCCAQFSVACTSDQDCCQDSSYGAVFAPVCRRGSCDLPCYEAGSLCEVDSDCCDGLGCGPVTSRCESETSCTSCAEALAIGLAPPQPPTCGTAVDQAHAALRGCACEGPCAGDCSGPCESGGSNEACDACMSSSCDEELAACQAQ